jgi:hypothetical protein
VAESHAFIPITRQIDPTAGSVASGSSDRPELRLTDHLSNKSNV